MSTVTEFNFTIKQLFSYLEKDKLAIDADKINKAKNGDADAMNSIGYEYQHEKKKYDKAMAWYRLAAAKNNPMAQNNIGILYDDGLGVSQDYFTAMEWYLKSAIQNHEIAWENIGAYFKNGWGVPVNKYKALEWYIKQGGYPNTIKALKKQGVQLIEQDKDKSIEQLIIETEDILSEAKSKREKKRREENETLKKFKFKLEQELRINNAKIESLEKQVQSYQVIEEQKQQIIDSLLLDKTKREGKLSEKIKTLQQLKEKSEKESAVEIKSLKKEIQTYRFTAEQKQQEIDNQQDSIKLLKQKTDEANTEIQSLKMTNTIQTTQLELKDSHIKTLEKITSSPCAVSKQAVESTSKRIKDLEKAVESTINRIDDLEKANRNLERLLEQERKLRDNEIMLAKQETQLLINKEKQEKRGLEIW